MMRFIYIFLFSCSILSAQVDWQKWEAKRVSFQLPSFAGEELVQDSSVSISILKSLKSVYSFFISDLDGENCPFSPSCSNFFIDAVKETNLISGTLMFADRFIRDMNIFKGNGHYALHKSGKYFDPAYNYTLNLQSIKFNPAEN